MYFYKGVIRFSFTFAPYGVANPRESYLAHQFIDRQQSTRVYVRLPHVQTWSKLLCFYFAGSGPRSNLTFPKSISSS